MSLSAAPATAAPGAGNEAIIRYLGDPVAAPSSLSPKYSREGIETAFRELCDRHGVGIERLGVDGSEFPFIVLGRLKGSREFMARIDSHLKATPCWSFSCRRHNGVAKPQRSISFTRPCIADRFLTS